jgi:RNA recognition motif-containing protein
MGKKLYCGNLSYDTTDDTLRQAFAEFGEIESVNVITDRYSGRSKGFGFVEMATDEAAQAAIEAMNGKSLDGRELKVAEAKPRRDRSFDRY